MDFMLNFIEIGWVFIKFCLVFAGVFAAFGFSLIVVISFIKGIFGGYKKSKLNLNNVKPFRKGE